jgi:hypothetical protein
MPAQPYDRDAEYGVVPVLYRSPESCHTLPDAEVDSTQARTHIPRRRGLGTENPARIAPHVKVPVMMLDGRMLMDMGERPHLDQHSFMYARDPLRFRGDWEDVDAVRDEYLPEVEALVRQQVGASHPVEYITA